MVRIIVVALASLVLLFSFAACSSQQTLDRAENFRQIGQASESYAEKVRGILERYQPGTISENALIQMVVAALPETWQAEYRKALDIGIDAWTAANDIANALDVTAADSFREYERLQLQAAEEANRWSNFMAIVESGINVATNPTGIVAVAGGILAGFLKRKGDKNLERVVVAFDQAQATDPSLRNAIQRNGDALREGMGDRLAKRVDKARIIDKIMDEDKT